MANPRIAFEFKWRDKNNTKCNARSLLKLLH